MCITMPAGLAIHSGKPFYLETDTSIDKHSFSSVPRKQLSKTFRDKKPLGVPKGTVLPLFSTINADSLWPRGPRGSNGGRRETPFLTDAFSYLFSEIILDKRKAKL